MIFTATEAADFLRDADQTAPRGWHPLHMNLGDDGHQHWQSDQRPGVKIERASYGQPYYITAPSIMGPDWFTRADTLEDARNVADQIA